MQNQFSALCSCHKPNRISLRRWWHTVDRRSDALTWQSCSNSKDINWGSLKSVGQSGNFDAMLRLAATHICRDFLLAKILLKCFETRESWRISSGWRCDAICTSSSLERMSGLVETYLEQDVERQFFEMRELSKVATLTGASNLAGGGTDIFACLLFLTWIVFAIGYLRFEKLRQATWLQLASHWLGWECTHYFLELCYWFLSTHARH